MASVTGTIRAVFFDLDDTLCDAQPAFDHALQAALDAVQVRHPHLNGERLRDGWQAVHVPLLADLAAGRRTMAEVRLSRFRRLLTLLDVSDDAWADELDLLLGRTQLQTITLFGDAVATLTALRRRGLHVGIITNGAGDTHPDSQRSKAEHLGLPPLVDSFFVSDEIGYRKPDPRAFLPALGAAGCAPGETLYVGDSVGNDIVGANRAGLVSVLVCRTTDALPETTAERQARYVVASLAGVVDLI